MRADDHTEPMLVREGIREHAGALQIDVSARECNLCCTHAQLVLEASELMHLPVAERPTGSQ